ncbi:MAG: DUF1194 domain-containing protein, partial [Pseudomonadota bacterium]
LPDNAQNTKLIGSFQLKTKLEQLTYPNKQSTDIDKPFYLVIDISGDGPNNQGGLVTNARDVVISKGVVINGLPIVADPWRSGIAFNVPDLTTYYEKCVIGGPGSFAIPVADWDDFAEVVRKKIVLELAGLEPTLPVIPAQLTGPPIEPIDCRVGERLRRLWLQNP